MLFKWFHAQLGQKILIGTYNPGTSNQEITKKMFLHLKSMKVNPKILKPHYSRGITGNRKILYSENPLKGGAP